MFAKLKNRWNNITDPRSDEGPKILSKEWFSFILVCLSILGAIFIFVLIAGDKAHRIFGYFAFGGFCFLMGIVFGLHRAKMMRLEENKGDKSNKSD